MAKKKLYENYRHPGGFTAFPRRVFNSPEYKQLSFKARCLLHELQYINNYKPQINGRIHFSVQRAAKALNASENTTRSAFAELQQAGFIAQNLDADYTKGRAREWRLTYEPCNGREPTDEWKMQDG